MTRRRITIKQDGSALIIRGWNAKALLEEAGCRPLFSGSARGWVLDGKRLPDVLARLQYRNIPVDVTGSPLAVAPHGPAETPNPEAQLGLWGEGS